MIYFTSDQHFGHQNIIDYVPRPFTSVYHMNEVIISRWNERVSPDDTVYVIGDVCMGRLDEQIEMVRRLLGEKILIPGNHDACHPSHRKYSEEWIQRYRDVGFDVKRWDEIVTLTIGEHEVRLCHFPYHESSGRHGDKYSAYRPDYLGDWLIHGHTHQTTVFSTHPHQFHVGVDAWDYYPVSLDTVERLITQHSQKSS